MTTEIMAVLFAILVQQMGLLSAETGENNEGFIREVSSTNASICEYSPTNTHKLLLMSDEALSQMASVNETLRHLLSHRGNASGVNIYETQICTSYDTEKMQCDYQAIRILQPEDFSSAIFKPVSKIKLPVCGIGTGDSGCGSFRNRTSPCGTISYETKSFDDNLSCEWVIHVHDGQQLLLSFKYINISYCGNQCLCDSVSVYDDPYKDKQILCGYGKDLKLITRSSIVRITLDINGSLPGMGFRMNYHGTQGTNLRYLPRIKLRANNGMFSIPPALSSRVEEGNHIFEWYIRIDESNRINLTWYLNSTCYNGNNITVAAYEGPFEAGITLKVVSVQSVNFEAALSNGFQLSVRLIQPRHCKIQRFDATYEGLQEKSRSDCENVSDGEFFLKSKEQVHQVLLSTENATSPTFRFYRYESPSGSYLSINVTSYQFRGPNIDNCAYEGFLFWTGYNNSDKYGPFCGTDVDTAFFNAKDKNKGSSPVIQSSSNTLDVFFYSYGITNRTKFTFNVSMSQCVGIFDIDGWDNLSTFGLFNYTRIGNSVILAPQKETCFHFQELPSEMPCNRTTSFSVTQVGVKYYHNVKYKIDEYIQVRGCDLGLKYVINDNNHGINETLHTVDCKCPIRAGGYLLGISTLIEEFLQFEVGFYGRNLSIYGVKHVVFKMWPYYYTSKFTLTAPLHLYDDHHFELSFRHNRWDTMHEKVLVSERHGQILYINKFQVHHNMMPFQYSSTWSYFLQTEISHGWNYGSYVLEYKLKANHEPLPDPVSYLCPGGAVRFEQACYIYYKIRENGSHTWNKAKNICEEQGGMLLSINDETELSFIKGMLKRQWITEDSSKHFIKRMIYIGLKPVDKAYRWLDGSVATFTEWYKPFPGEFQMFTESLFGARLHFASPLLMQPSNDQSCNCTAMVVVTPSMPTQWLRIPCHFPYPNSSFICEYRMEKVDNQSKQNEISKVGDTIRHREGNLRRIVPGTNICPVGYTAREGRCYKLVSSIGPIKQSISCSTAKEMCTSEMGEIATNVTSDPSELLYIWLHRPEYGNVWVRDCDHLMYNDTESQWKLEAAQPNTTSSRVLNVLCGTYSLNVIPVCALGQFKCNDGTCISDTHRCDGKPHCPEGDDEASCECWDSSFRCGNSQCIPFSKYCDFVSDCKDNSDEKNCTYRFCPENYGRCDNGQCLDSSKFGDYKVDCMDASDERDEDSICDVFRCNSGECLPKSMIKNMRPDCTGLEQEDETLVLDEVKRGVWTIGHTTHSNMTPYCPMGNGSLTRCRVDHVLCFERHLACIYDDDEYGYMASCPDGEHLRNCRSFECPHMFKCPESYCVPYHKICDGKPDCPHGDDEDKCVYGRCSNTTDKQYGQGDGNCTNISCPGLFKCSKEGICLDQSLVCDGIVHCKISFDDEVACPYTKCPSGCWCEGRSVNCTDVTNDTMSAIPFDVRLLFLLPKENGSLIDMQADWFKDFIHLGKLHLKGLGIKSIKQGVFRNLHNLLTLDISDNLLRSIQKGMFVGLNNLQHLNLSGNPVQIVGEDAFEGLTSIRYLRLDNLKIKSVADGCFRSLRSVAILSLMNNSISHVSPRTWTGLDNMRTLYLNGNVIKQVPSNTFNNLKLKELHTDHFKLCCVAKLVTNCTPEADAYSSCEDLLANSILQVLIWVLGVTAVIGNLVVIITRLITQGKQVSSILIVNLSVSDFLMGIYLLIIASADVTYRGKYTSVADDWRSSWLCKFAGFLSTVSSEMSVFMLVVIAADRLVSIVFTFKTRKLSMQNALFIMTTGWILFSGLSSIPLIGLSYFGNQYIKNGVCMLFNVTGGKSKGWEYSTFIFLLFNVIGFVFLFISYVYMYWFVNEKRLRANRDATDKEFELAQKFVLIVATDFICWVPLVCIAFLSRSGIPINPTASAWVAVIVLPINSALNPFLYTFSALRQIKKNRRRQRYRHSSTN